MVSGSEFTSTCRRGNDRSSAGLLIGAPPHGMRTADHRPARATGPNFSASTIVPTFPPQTRCCGCFRRSVAADSIVIAVEAVVIRSDHRNCAREVGGAIAAASGAIHIARDRYALSGIVRVT